MNARQPMSNGDAAWLHMDRPTNLMVITSVMWFDEPLDGERLRGVIEERLVGRFVRFRQRAVESPLPLRGPHWEDDPDFDLDRHVHHRGLAAPGGPAELTELVSDLMSTPLDRSKPLWDLYLVDDYGGGSALISRMHHCIADGIALARVMLSLTDEHPDAGFAGDPPGAGARAGRVPRCGARPRSPSARRPRRCARRAASPGRWCTRARTRSCIRRRRRTWPARPRGTRGCCASCCSPGRTPRPSSRAGWARRAGPPGAPSSTSTRSRRSATAPGATVNDVLVTALTGGLRDYLRERDSAAIEVRAMVPFNLRPVDEPLPSTLGNEFGLVYLPLPVGLRARAIASRRSSAPWTRSRPRPRARSPTGSSGSSG